MDLARLVELLSADDSVYGAGELAHLISSGVNPGANFWLVEARGPTASLSGVKESFDVRGGPLGVVIGGDVDYLVGRLREIPSDERIIGGSVWDATADRSGWEAQVYFRRGMPTLLGFLNLRLGTLAGGGDLNAN